MRERDSFSGYHPVVTMLFFVLSITGTVLFTHPVCLVLSFVCAFGYACYLKGGRHLRFQLKFMLPLMLVTAAINPAFNHQGATILWYFENGNPLTLESILYGLFAALMLVASITWFSSFNAVMTSDKFVYLFGRLIPALSLVLSMSLRLVPCYKEQIARIAGAQRCIGRDVGSGNIFARARHGVRILSIMVTWALESAIETADSMRGRGFGLRGRTAFSIYRFDARDRKALLWLLVCAAFIAAGLLTGSLHFAWYPLAYGAFGAFSWCVFAVWFALCATPLAIVLHADYRWKQIYGAMPSG